MNQQMTTVELLRQRQSFPLQTTATSFQSVRDTLKRPFQDVNGNQLQTLQNRVYPSKRYSNGGSESSYGRENRGFAAVVDTPRILKDHPSQNRVQGFSGIINHVSESEQLVPTTELDLVLSLVLTLIPVPSQMGTPNNRRPSLPPQGR
jgi:hypothetical protein